MTCFDRWRSQRSDGFASKWDLEVVPSPQVRNSPSYPKMQGLRMLDPGVKGTNLNVDATWKSLVCYAQSMTS